MENTGTTPLPLLVSVSSAPRVFGMSRSYIYKLAKRGEIDLVKMGGATMIRTESMHAYINSLPPMKPGQS
ncbi:hypothetical protein HC62_04045 [Acetobacter tropicalis]|uniref:Uncharacterized protein n=1 Tax=Acetobacter tropicalis TaxID=104102 RepID=A0A252AAI4_9PROT|nr:hypothetical protein HC62_04045 [Acetobacter tropicalis]